MDILSIGNSFSQDAQRYLHRIAKADGFDLTCVNLYVGGCSLEMHHRFMHSDKAEYVLEINGEHSGFYVSLKEALLNRPWDVITFQQRTIHAVDHEMSVPYLKELSAYVKDLCPKARQIVHQTWAYEEGLPYMHELGYRNTDLMFADIKKAYQLCAKDIGCELIPSGELLNRLHHKGVKGLYRDGCHVSKGIGRYALGLLWYSYLSQKDIADNSFCDFDKPIEASDIKIIKETVKEIL